MSSVRNIPGGKELKAAVAFAVLLLLLVPGMIAHAQQYSFAQFGQSDGLLNEDVTALVQDHAGVLWIGTQDGLFQMDGSRLVAVPGYRMATDGIVMSLHVDTQGLVWALGAKHLVFFDRDGAMHRVSGFKADQLAGDDSAIASLPAQPGVLFLLLNARLIRLSRTGRGEGWQSEELFSSRQVADALILRRLHGLIADPVRGTLWAGCGTSICEIRPAAGASPKVPGIVVWDQTRGVSSGAWNALALGGDGNLWARDHDDVIELNPRTSLSMDRGNPEEGKEQFPQHPELLQSPSGEMMANLVDGVAEFKDGRWRHLGIGNGLPPTQLFTMYVDRSGGFWLAPVGGGLWRWLGYGNWETWTRNEGLSSDVVWTFRRGPHGELWIGTDGGLDQLQPGADRVEQPEWGRMPRGVGSMALDARGYLWIANAYGDLAVVQPGQPSARRLLPNIGPIYSMLEEHPGGDPWVPADRIWICGASGVAYVSDEDGWLRLHRVRDRNAPLSKVWAAAQDHRGNLWFTASGSLYRYASGAWQRIELPVRARLLDYTLPDIAPDGTIWMQATMPTPLLRMRVEGSRATVVESVDGSMIGSDDIFFINADRRGWLWVGTDRGIYVRKDGHWVHCTQEDGLVSDDTDFGGVFVDGDGSLWFGTVRGISHLLHPESLFETGTPQLNIRDVRLNGLALRPGQSFNLQHPQLSAHLFSADYTRSRAIAFRYRLLGLEDAWLTTEDGMVRFSGVPPGRYTLAMEAVDVRAHTFSPVIDYSFELLPPWYERNLTLAIAGLLLLALILIGWRLSLRHLVASEANLKRKVDQQTALLQSEKAELERAQAELVRAASRDSLTGLLNRSAIFEVLHEMSRQSLERRKPLAIIMADMDHFKAVNDRYGHAAGDAVLRQCAECLMEMMRPGDAVGRYGGEELLLVIPGLDLTHAPTRMEAIRAAIAAHPVTYNEQTIRVTCSFGVAWLDRRNGSIEAALNAADAALYLAKQNGRDQVQFAPEQVEDALLVEQL